MIKYVEKRKIKNLKKQIVNFDIEKIKTVIGASFLEVKKNNLTIKNKEKVTLNKDEINLILSISNKVKNKLDMLNKEIISVEYIQDIIEKTLIQENLSEIAKAYILYRNERSKIRNSNERLMKQISEITFSNSKDSNIKRDNGNVDGNTSMGTMLQYGSAVSNEFNSKFIMNPKHAYAHENGDIHTHDKEFLPIGTTTCSEIPLDKLFKDGFSTGHGHLREPQDIISYSALTAVAIQANQNDQHGGQAIPALDYFLAPGVLKTFNKKLKDNFIKFIEIRFFKIDAEKYTNDILDKFEEIKSIQFNKLQKKKLMNISRNILFNDFKTQDKMYEINNVEKMIDYILEKALKETDKQTYQAMEALVHNLNTLHSRAGAQVPFSSINFGTDESPEGRMVSKNLLLAQEAGLGKGETPIFPILIFKVKKGVNYYKEDRNYDLFRLSMRVSAKRLFPNFAFIDAPFNLKYYKKGIPETEIAYMGCRTRTISDILGEDIVYGKGNISFTSINLVRLGIKHGICLGKRKVADIDNFYKELDEKIKLVIQQLLERFEIQASKKVKNFPFLMGQGVWNGAEKLNPEDEIRDIIKHGSLSIGFIGLAETLIALTGKHHGESENAQKLGLEIISHMRKRCDEATKKYQLNFALLATPAEGLSSRFVTIDKKIYGNVKGVTEKAYYTNSFHVPVYYEISAFKKIDIEAPYHKLTNGGHITYIELNGDITKNIDAFEEVIRYMCEKGIGYGSINHPIDRCPVCGFDGVIGDTCPICSHKDGERGIFFQRIRRITGYLVGTLDRFGNGKKAEEKERVKHALSR